MSNDITIRSVRYSSSLVLGAVLLAGLFVASAVRADSGPKGMTGSRYEHRGVMPNFVGHALQGLLRSQKELGLSAEQGTKIKAISTEYAKERIQGEANVKLAELDVRTNMLNDKADMSTIEAALRKSESARTALRLEGVKAFRAASALLTPEQREKWHQKMTARDGSGMRGYRHGSMADPDGRPDRGDDPVKFVGVGPGAAIGRPWSSDGWRLMDPGRRIDKGSGFALYLDKLTISSAYNRADRSGGAAPSGISRCAKAMTIKATDERCAREIMETVPLVMRFIRREMRSQGSLFLSVPQLRTLVYLDRTPGTDLSSVADHLGVTPATASAVVNRLVQQGLVTRETNARNRRNVALTLTRIGSQRLRRVREKACSFVVQVLAERPASELQKIMDGIAVLGKVFKDVDGHGSR